MGPMALFHNCRCETKSRLKKVQVAEYLGDESTVAASASFLASAIRRGLLTAMASAGHRHQAEYPCVLPLQVTVSIAPILLLTKHVP